MVQDYVKISGDPAYLEFLSLIRNVCQSGGIVPSRQDMRDALRVSSDRLEKFIEKAADEGLIRFTGRNGGRIATWLETGQASVPRGIKSPQAVRKPAENTERLHDAKQFLRRIYPNVYDSRITGGPRGFVEVHGVGRLTNAELFEHAASKGWVG